MVLRKMLFDLLPDVCVAELRAFRQSGPELSQLIIFGTVAREAPESLRVTFSRNEGEAARVSLSS